MYLWVFIKTKFLLPFFSLLFLWNTNLFDQIIVSTIGKSAPVQVRIMETTDIHTNIANYDYYQDTTTSDYGLALTSSLVKKARSEVKNTLLIDNGDLLQGNPLGDYKATVSPLKNGEIHPVYQAMNLMGYDVGNLGNHDFNYGLSFLDTALKGAKFPYTNANIYENGKNRWAPYILLDKNFVDENGKKQKIRIGVIGFTPPQILQWDKDQLQNRITVEDMVTSAKKWIPEMKQKGADVIVAVPHSGIDLTEQPNQENAVYALSKVNGIDAILFGHSHKVFPSTQPEKDGWVGNGIDNIKGTINGVPAVEAGFWGNDLGIIDLKIVKEKGKWKVADSQSSNRTVKQNDVKPDPAILEAIKKSHEETLNYIRSGIGSTTAPIYSYFSQVLDDPVTQVISNAQTWYIKDKLKGTPYESYPLLSAAAPFKAGGRSGATYYTDIPAGPLSVKSVSDIYGYANTIKAVLVNGAQIKEWLEWSAGQFNQIDPTNKNEQSLVNDQFPSYNFDVIDGITYEIDVTQPAKYDSNGNLLRGDASRIKNLRWNGQDIKPDQKFVVATNNYRAAGKFANPEGNNVIFNGQDENRQAIMNYIQSQKTVDPTPDGNWAFTPIAENPKVVFSSSLKGQQFVSTSKKISYLGQGENGFAKYGVDLSPRQVHVQILGINDFHGQLDYTKTLTYSSGPVNLGGAPFLAAYLKQRKAENPNTLLVHAGDVVGASAPVSALLQDEPTIDFLNRTGFDVGTIGNHELDQGKTEFLRLINGGKNPKNGNDFSGANFPYVCANVLDGTTGQPFLPPYVIKEVGGVKVGFVGVITMETPSIVKPTGIEGLKFVDQTTAVNNAVTELKSKGVRSIVVLAHDPGMDDGKGNGSGEVIDLAKTVDPEVDVIIAGHNHGKINMDVANQNQAGKKIRVVEAYSSGTAFDDVELEINKDTGDVTSVQADIVDVIQANVTADPEIQQMVKDYQDKNAPILNAPVGKATQPINRTKNAAGESALGNLIADGMRATMGTDFAFMNSGGIRQDLSAGDVTYGQLFNIQPFGNVLIKMTLSGKEIRELLNEQWNNSRTRIGEVSGLKYTWKESNPSTSKVVDIVKSDGTPLQDDQMYTIAVNDFCAAGGDGYTILKQGTNKVAGPVDLDALVTYIKGQFTSQNKSIDAQIDGRVTKLP